MTVLIKILLLFFGHSIGFYRGVSTHTRRSIMSQFEYLGVIIPQFFLFSTCSSCKQFFALCVIKLHQLIVSYLLAIN